MLFMYFGVYRIQTGLYFEKLWLYTKMWSHIQFHSFLLIHTTHTHTLLLLYTVRNVLYISDIEMYKNSKNIKSRLTTKSKNSLFFSVSTMGSLEKELKSISKELKNLSLKRQQLQERKTLHCTFQELRTNTESKQTGYIWKIE